MAENIFVRSFCEAQERLVCTTSAELNFDNYTDVGKYYIYEDTGNGTNKQYIVLVDYSKDGCKTQTKLCSGNIESRCYKDNAWTSWKSTTGGSGANIIVDQTYKQTSENAQSGKAVAEAVAIEREYADVIADNVYQGIANMGGQIQQLGQDVEGLQQQLSGIDTALENIIAIQNSYIGGDSV